MTEFHWETENKWREHLFVLLAMATAALIYALVVGPLINESATRWFVGAFLSAWAGFSTYRSRPRKVTLVGHELSFSNLGVYSLEELASARTKRLLGLESVLELKIGGASGSIALHGMPESSRAQLVSALNERVNR